MRKLQNQFWAFDIKISKMFINLTRTMTTSIKRNEKQSLRKLIKAKVSEISEKSKSEQSEWITKQILQLEEFQKSKYLGKVE